MLTQEELQHQADETANEANALELEMLIAIASSMMSVRVLSPKNINREAVNLQRRLNTINARHSSGILLAAKRDLYGQIMLDAVRNSKTVAKATNVASVVTDSIERAAARVSDAYAVVSGDITRMQRNMSHYARVSYLQEMRKAARNVNRIGYERSLKIAMENMAQKGITANVYQRRGKDGKVINVEVPVDVGFRSVIEQAGKERRNLGALDLAKRTTGLVEVNITAGARPSHEVWQGRIYSVDGKNPMYPNFDVCCHFNSKIGKPTDYVEGFGGYNCRHQMTPHILGAPDQYSDPLDGTGYTQEEARKVRARQRYLENEKRKAKRAREVLKSQGLPTRDISQSIKRYNYQLDNLVAENRKILRRKPWRENIYIKASNELKNYESYRSYKSSLVDLDLLDSDLYRTRVADVFSGEMSNYHFKAIRSMLRHRSGTEYEDLYAFDLTTGSVISCVVNSKTPREVYASERMKRRMKKAKRKGHIVVTAHNHPGSSLPSWNDIESLEKSGADFGIIACHDGSLYKYSRVKAPEPGYNDEDNFNSVIDGFAKKGETSVLKALEDRLGVRIEHFC